MFTININGSYYNLNPRFEPNFNCSNRGNSSFFNKHANSFGYDRNLLRIDQDYRNSFISERNNILNGDSTSSTIVSWKMLSSILPSANYNIFFNQSGLKFSTNVIVDAWIINYEGVFDCTNQYTIEGYIAINDNYKQLLINENIDDTEKLNIWLYILASSVLNFEVTHLH